MVISRARSMWENTRILGPDHYRTFFVYNCSICSHIELVKILRPIRPAKMKKSGNPSKMVLSTVDFV